MLSQSPQYSASQRVLCLSNGHGEDIIAVRILQELQQLPNPPALAALPLVGEGKAYQALDIPLIGPVKAMPSGGFIYMDGGKQLARDIRGGLLQLTLKQIGAIREWVKQGGSILVVGDIFPLLLAYLSGAPYAFIGTAKSEYYLRDDTGAFYPHAFWEGWSGSVYYPWERWMMSHRRCRAVFPRDPLTTKILQKWPIAAFDLGNPMMDGLDPQLEPFWFQSNPVIAGSRDWATVQSTAIRTASTSGAHQLHPPRSNGLIGLLLPGSRIPEAYENWQLLLQAVDGLPQSFANQPLVLLTAVAPNLNLEPLIYSLKAQGWQPCNRPPRVAEYDFQAFPDSQAQWFYQGSMALALTQYAYADSLHGADWAIAMAGTATEQFVGLGKPAIIFPGKGPQFIRKFAEAQTRLLGKSVILVQNPTQVAIALEAVLQNPARLQAIAENGRDRMGEPGAAKRIATCLMQQLQVR